MRIRDRGITKVRNRATAGLLCLIRSRNADASNLLAALFMRQVQYDTVEEALYMERLLQVRRYQFNLEFSSHRVLPVSLANSVAQPLPSLRPI